MTTELYRAKNWTRLRQRFKEIERSLRLSIPDGYTTSTLDDEAQFDFNHRLMLACAEMQQAVVASAEQLMRVGMADCTVLMDHRPMVKRSAILASFPENWAELPTTLSVTMAFLPSSLPLFDDAPSTYTDAPNVYIPQDVSRALFNAIDVRKTPNRMLRPGLIIDHLGKRHFLARCGEFAEMQFSLRDGAVDLSPVSRSTLIFIDADCVEIDDE